MKIYIVIPVYNEATHIAKTLDSLLKQTLSPDKIMIVDDSSKDETATIIEKYTSKFSSIRLVTKISEASHKPGSKVIEAFNFGLQHLDQEYDVICKFDGDLIFPQDYLERVAKTFIENDDCGMAGGFCYIEKNGSWVLENLTNKDHLRGALKAYSKDCFTKIGGLKPSIGWDTVDEMLCKYHNLECITIPDLKVKHLKPTGNKYASQAAAKQGEAFYKLRYGVTLTRIASLKMAIKKNAFPYYFNCMRGYYKAKKDNVTPLVTKKEGAFIRELRWEGIKKKLS